MAFEAMAIVSAVGLAVLYQSMLGCCVVTLLEPRTVTHFKPMLLL